MISVLVLRKCPGGECWQESEHIVLLAILNDIVGEYNLIVCKTLDAEYYYK